MRDTFIGYFKQAEAAIREQKRGLWLVDIIDKALLVEGMRLPLRSDGFVFLYLNVLQMVVAPWEGIEERDFDRPEGMYMVSTDIKMILREAALHSKREGHEEISANAIFQTIAALGDELRTRAEEFWGP